MLNLNVKNNHSNSKKLETNQEMKPKLTFLLALTFLFLFSGSVYAKEEVKREYWGKGKLYKEIHYKNGKREGLKTGWYESGEKWYEENYKNGKKEGLENGWYESGAVSYTHLTLPTKA